ncbi:MAG: hypothetical protein DHS80DRAFT_24788 [Piptocephalis tieghemiana]|nr:MAG: hypothetical protein DHS80DRAFT_24788 [Piptocephalis tieghemiana]
MKPTSAALFLLIALLASTAVCALPGIRPWTPEDNNAPSSQGTSRRSPSPIEGRVARRRRLSSSSRSSSSSPSRQRSRSPSPSHGNLGIPEDLFLRVEGILNVLLDGGSGPIGSPWVPERYHQQLLEMFRTLPRDATQGDDLMQNLTHIRAGVGKYFEEDLGVIRIGNSSSANGERIGWMYRLTDHLNDWFQDYATSQSDQRIKDTAAYYQHRMDRMRARDDFPRHG